MSDAPPAANVLGGPLKLCSAAPRTGWLRDGCCHTGPEDRGMHVICAVMTADFLAYSRAQGNDLITPAPAFGFPGLKPGDRWCLCASRWEDARRAGVAPPVDLESTHAGALRVTALEHLLIHAAQGTAEA